MGATTADRHWPPDGAPPDGTRLDAMGYVDDRDTVLQIVDALDAAPDLLVSHLNGPDTAAHLYGPDSDGALAGYRDTDAVLAVMREHIDWDETVWILVSDHDQENVTVREPVDLQAEIGRRGLELFALPEGSASLVCGEGAEQARAWLTDVDGVAGTASFTLASTSDALECCLVWSEPGRAFGFTGEETRLGTHGGPRTRAQVAVVAGGHPGGRTAGPGAARHADRSRRLGAHDRRAARCAAADRDRTDAGRIAAGQPAAATSSTAPTQASSPGTAFPRTLAASSARRSATRSSHSGMASNASVSSGSITPPWNASVVSLRAESPGASTRRRS